MIVIWTFKTWREYLPIYFISNIGTEQSKGMEWCSYMICTIIVDSHLVSIYKIEQIWIRKFTSLYIPPSGILKRCIPVWRGKSSEDRRSHTLALRVGTYWWFDHHPSVYVPLRYFRWYFQDGKDTQTRRRIHLFRINNHHPEQHQE